MLRVLIGFTLISADEVAASMATNRIPFQLHPDCGKHLPTCAVYKRDRIEDISPRNIALPPSMYAWAPLVEKGTDYRVSSKVWTTNVGGYLSFINATTTAGPPVDGQLANANNHYTITIVLLTAIVSITVFVSSLYLQL